MSQAVVLRSGRGSIGSSLAYGDARLVVCRLALSSASEGWLARPADR